MRSDADFGLAIVALGWVAGFNQKALAGKLKVNEGVIGDWKKGSNFSHIDNEALTRVLRLTTSEIEYLAAAICHCRLIMERRKRQSEDVSEAHSGYGSDADDRYRKVGRAVAELFDLLDRKDPKDPSR